MNSISFFSPSPRAMHALCAAKKLIPRDVQVHALLFDYKSIDSAIVDPSQDEMARRLNCSKDTIQRSLIRLEKCGLILKVRLRDSLGRLGKNLYDLSLTLAMLPAKAAKMRLGHWGQSQKQIVSNPSRMNAVPKKRDLSSVKEEQTGTPAVAVADPAVVALIDEGIRTEKAQEMVDQHGAATVQKAVKAAPAVGKAKNRAGWIIDCLRLGWLTPKSAPKPTAGVKPPRPFSALFAIEKESLGVNSLNVDQLRSLAGRVGYEAVLSDMRRIRDWHRDWSTLPASMSTTYDTLKYWADMAGEGETA